MNTVSTPTSNWTVCALYRFVKIDDRETLQKEIKEICDAQDICGTILIAPEGVNGTVGAPTLKQMNMLIDHLDARVGVRQGEVKYSEAHKRPFIRTKIRLKKEIVTLRQPQVDPTRTVGTYVDPKDWNDLISDPDVIVLDTRNVYETQLGTFKNAVDPQTDVFTQFPDFVKSKLDPQKHQKVAMFCTGGIRCEKASSYMLHEGFKEVYHLKGGILKYLEEVPPEESMWEGECFVFDRRVGIKHGLEQGILDTCYGCRASLYPQDKERAEFEEGVCCHHCAEGMTEDQKESKRMRHKHKLAFAHKISA